MTRLRRGGVMARAVLERGGRVMTAGSTGSTPRDWAGGPSMRMSGLAVSALIARLGNGRHTYPQDLHSIKRVLPSKHRAHEHQ